MERLTFEGNFCDIAQCRELSCPYNGACSQRKVWERLKAYEDTGLMPEEVTAMRHTLDEHHKVADPLLREQADGRVVVLPCEVGDTVYWVHGAVITECKVHRIQKNRNGLYICLKSKKSHGAFRTDLCFGKSIFLTREEAEKALEAMKDG